MKEDSSENVQKPLNLNAGYVRSKMPEQRHSRSNTLAILIFAANIFAYLLTFGIIVFAPYWIIKIFAVVLNGFSIGGLFIVAHDACHGSFTSSRMLNHILGRIAFLPSLNPFSAWEYGHNHLHHGWTNFKPREYAFVPLSKQEFDSLQNWRKHVYRFYRTVIGVPFCYQIEVWWKHLIFPQKSDLKKIKTNVFIFDFSLTMAFLLLEIVAVLFVPQYLTKQSDFEIFSSFALVVLAVILPFAVCSCMVAFITLQHHTHSEVPWFDKKAEWNFFNSQVRGSVRIVLPRFIEILFNNILEHTAHHSDTKIPLYNLRESQHSLEKAFSKDITVQPSSILQLHRTLKICKLYDYDNHCWTDFEGNITAKIKF